MLDKDLLNDRAINDNGGRESRLKGRANGHWPQPWALAQSPWPGWRVGEGAAAQSQGSEPGRPPSEGGVRSARHISTNEAQKLEKNVSSCHDMI